MSYVHLPNLPPPYHPMATSFFPFLFLFILFTLSNIYCTYASWAEQMSETIIQIKLNRVKNPNWREAIYKHDQGFVALSIQLKMSKFLVGMLSHGKDHFGLIRPEYSGPALMMVLFDQFSHFSRLDQNVPSSLRKLLSPVPLFCILLARTILPNV